MELNPSEMIMLKKQTPRMRGKLVVAMASEKTTKARLGPCWACVVTS